MKPVRFHPLAKAELGKQAQYYDVRSAGLGSRFVEQVEQATHLAGEMPGIGSPYKYRTRRVFPKDFPYSVIYLEVVVVAVAAFRRREAYWRGRKA